VLVEFRLVWYCRAVASESETTKLTVRLYVITHVNIIYYFRNVRFHVNTELSTSAGIYHSNILHRNLHWCFLQLRGIGFC